VIKTENFQNSRWWMAAIFKIIISPYVSEKSSDFDDILYTTADFEQDERHVIKMKKLHWTYFEFDRTYFLLTNVLLFLGNETRQGHS